MKSMCPCLSFPGAWAESPKFVIGEFDTGVSKSGVTANLFAWVVFVPLQMPLTYLGTSLCVTESLDGEGYAGECEQDSEFPVFLLPVQ